MRLKNYLNESSDKLIKAAQRAQKAYNKALDSGKGDEQALNKKLQDIINKAQKAGIPAIKGVYGRQ
jgi:hypothetical protein